MAEPTQADRDAAEQWRWSIYNSEEVNPMAQVEADLAELAADFAAHRETSTAALSKRVETLEALARECEAMFRFYEQSHLAKKTQDGDEKAYRNKQMADKCKAALGGDHA